MTNNWRQRIGFLRAAVFSAGALTLAVGAPAAERTVHVGDGGSRFMDDVSGTNVTTINVGDTVRWVWKGAMEHSVTSGTCDHTGGGGGGGGYGGYGGAGGGTCEDAHLWTSTGLHGAGFSYTQVFPAQGTYSYYCAMHESAMTGKVVVLQAAGAAGCTPDEHTLCFGGGRFSARTHWTKPDSTEGDGNAVPLTDDSGYFWFFDATNIEAVAKVLNGCALNHAYWVFAAGLTNVAVHLTVTDTQTGAVYTRDNAQGAAFLPIQDTAAFPASCP